MLGKKDSPKALDRLIAEKEAALDTRARKLLEIWPQVKADYAGDEYKVKIRGPRPVLQPEDQEPERHAGAPGRPAEMAGRRRNPALAAARECAGQLPLYRRRLRLQARRRGPDAHVRRRGRRGAHQPPLPLSVGEFRGQAPFHRLRQRDPVRPGPGAAAGYLRQGRHLGRLDLDAGGHEGPVQRFRPVRAGDLGLDDDQRPGADHPGDVPEHRHRPAGRPVPRGQRPGADRRGDRKDPRLDPLDRPRHGPGRYPERGPGPEHLPVLDGIQRSR